MPATMTRVLPPYEERLAQAVAEVERAIADRKPYQMMDTAFRYSIQYRDLRDAVRRVREQPATP